MKCRIRTYMLAAALLPFSPAFAEDPAYIGRHESTPQDMSAIMQLTKDFRSALTEKNTKKLSTLMLNSNILFSSPPPPDAVKKINDTQDTNFDGVVSGGYLPFAQYVRSTKDSIEERFYNIKITQDGHLGWVMFDFEFVEDTKVENYGVETWQVLKTVSGQWKIMSIVWSSHGAPK